MGGRSYLKTFLNKKMPHTLPIVETRNLNINFLLNELEYYFNVKVLSPADYPYLLDYHQSFTKTFNAEVFLQNAWY